MEPLPYKSLWLNLWQWGKWFDENKNVAAFFAFPEKNQKAVAYTPPLHVSWNAFTTSQHTSEALLTILYLIHRHWPIVAKTDGMFESFLWTHLSFWRFQKPFCFKETGLGNRVCRFLWVWSFISTDDMCFTLVLKGNTGCPQAHTTKALRTSKQDSKSVISL